MLPFRVEEIENEAGSFHAIRLDGIRNSQSFRVAVRENERTTVATLEMDRYAGPILRAMASRVCSGNTQWEHLIRESTFSGVVTVFNLNGKFVDFATLADTVSWATLEIQCTLAFRHKRDDRSTQIRMVAGQLFAMCTDSLEIVFDSDNDPEENGAENAHEGREFQARVTKYERSPINRFRCIQHFGVFCQVCGLDFEEFYGPLGAGFIEVHHRNPVSSLGESTVVDPVVDLIPLCSNCHSMAHRSNPPVPPEVLRELLGK